MKRWIVIAVSVLLVFSLVACQKTKTVEDNKAGITEEPKITDQPETTPEPKTTNEPEVTQEPEATEELEETTEPEVTEEPEVIEENNTEIDFENAKLVALTFDDGPSLQTTPKVLDILEKYDIVATFFLIGQNVNANTKDIMQRQLDLGCEIANHSYTHTRLSEKTPEEIQEEIKKTNDIIFETIGVTPSFFRPPYIAVNNIMYNNIELPFICGIMANDWENTTSAEKRADAIIKTVKDGDIILLHDFGGNELTVTAIDTIIPALQEQGYVFVTVSDLFKYKGVDPNVEFKIWSNVPKK